MRQVCVIGLGQFGSHLARTLVKLGCEVLAIDAEERRVDAIRDDVHRALIGDARDYQMLASVITPSVDEAVICLGEKNLEPSILCALNLRRIGVKTIRSTATNDDHAQILEAVGATETIFPERDAAERLARRVANPDIRDMFPLAEDFRIMEITAPGRTTARHCHNWTCARSSTYSSLRSGANGTSTSVSCRRLTALYAPARY